MTTIEVNLEDYLSEDDRRDIAREEFRVALKRSLSTSNDVERFVGNVAYMVIWEEADATIRNSFKRDDLRQEVRAKVRNIVGKMELHTIVQYSDGFLRRKPTVAAEIIEETVKGSRGLIEERVRELIKGLNRMDIMAELHAQLDEIFKGVWS